MVRMFSAGGVVYKPVEGGLVWLIRKPTPNENYQGNLGWSLPKGLIDKGETVEQAAIREVREEGGVEAEIVQKLETLKIFFTDNSKERVMKFITYYLMRWSGNVPEGYDWETAEVKWVGIDEAVKLLVFSNERKLIKKAYEAVA